jgi:hypothetical protein
MTLHPRHRTWIGLSLILAIILLAAIIQVSAITNFTPPPIIYGATTTAVATDPCSLLRIYGNVTFDAQDDTGSGVDYFGVAAVNAGGDVEYAIVDFRNTGPRIISVNWYVTDTDTSPSPITLYIYEVTAFYSGSYADTFAWLQANNTGILYQQQVSLSDLDPACAPPTLPPTATPAPGAPGITPQPPLFDDDRINRDAFASAVMYCRGGGIHIYEISRGAGVNLLIVTGEQVAETAGADDNVVIASFDGASGEISLWRLAGGQLQLVAPGLPPETDKPYIYRFDAGACGLS